jgi:hypothetical protein
MKQSMYVTLCLGMFAVAAAAGETPPPAAPASGTVEIESGTVEIQKGRLLSYEMPAITVTASPLREEERIGPYQQPRWSARRRFTETRSYVIPEGSFEFEYWNIMEKPRNGGDLEITTKYEAEIGLPYHLQLDLYAVTHQVGNDGPMRFDEQDVEMRWALADWGKIPGNPALYLEWKALDSAPDHVEAKLLLADEIMPKLHWSANLVLEQEMGGKHESSYEFAGALSYTVKDEVFSVGSELKVAFVNDRTNRGMHDPEILLGPSCQISPLKPMHIDFALLGGLSESSPVFKSIIVVGWEF